LDIIVGDKLHPIFNVAPSILEKKYGIDLKEESTYDELFDYYDELLDKLKADGKIYYEYTIYENPFV